MNGTQPMGLDEIVGAFSRGVKLAVERPRLGAMLAAAGLVPIAGSWGQLLGERAAAPGAETAPSFWLSMLVTLSLLAVVFFEAGSTGTIAELLLGGTYSDIRVIAHGLRLFSRFFLLRLLCLAAFLPAVVASITPLWRFVFGEGFDNPGAWTEDAVLPLLGFYATLFAVVQFFVLPFCQASMAVEDTGLASAVRRFGRFLRRQPAAVAVMVLANMLASWWDFWHPAAKLDGGLLAAQTAHVVLRAYVTIALTAAAIELYTSWLGRGEISQWPSGKSGEATT